MLTWTKSEIKRDTNINKKRDDANNHQITKSEMLTLTKNECWVFSCLCNPPDSDMDYRIFNVSTRLFLCVHIHTGEHRLRVSTTFLTRRKNLTMCSWRRRGSNLRSFGSLDLESDALPTEPPRLPVHGLYPQGEVGEDSWGLRQMLDALLHQINDGEARSPIVMTLTEHQREPIRENKLVKPRECFHGQSRVDWLIDWLIDCF